MSALGNCLADGKWGRGEESKRASEFLPSTEREEKGGSRFRKEKGDPPPGSISLLQQLTELRKAFYVLEHQFVIKGSNSGAASWKRGLEQGVWEGEMGFHTLSRKPRSGHPRVLSNPEAHCISEFKNICGVLSATSPLPRGQRVGLKAPTLSLLGLSGDQPHPEAI